MAPERNTQLDRPGVPTPVDPERHARLCAICRSEDRLEIEDAFLHWISPDYIVRMFDVPDRMTIYRHAHATGLFEYRRRNVRSALERLIENANSVQVTGDCVIRAIRALSRVGEDGRWTDPVQRVIVSRRPASFAVSEGEPQEAFHREILIDTQKRLESSAIPTKQTTEPISTRDKMGTLEGPSDPAL